MKTYGGVDILFQVFLTSALVRGKWSDSRPSCLTPGERALGSHWIGGWVDPRTGLHVLKKWIFLAPPRFEPLGSPASRYTDCATAALSQI
jgi:hypothetical protein